MVNPSPTPDWFIFDAPSHGHFFLSVYGVHLQAVLLPSSTQRSEGQIIPDISQVRGDRPRVRAGMQKYWVPPRFWAAAMVCVLSEMCGPDIHRAYGESSRDFQDMLLEVSGGSQDIWELTDWDASPGSRWAGVSSLTAQPCRLSKSNSGRLALPLRRVSSGLMWC